MVYGISGAREHRKKTISYISIDKTSQVMKSFYTEYGNCNKTAVTVFGKLVTPLVGDSVVNRLLNL